jgi:putative Mn2+ efflux pump MntP
VRQVLLHHPYRQEVAMQSTSVPLLLAAAGAVGFLHSILPDHWVPLAVIARTQRWSILHTARISLLASIGHVLTSIILAGIIAAVGLQFRNAFEMQQGHIVGVILILTGLGFVLWVLTGQRHDHRHQHGHSSIPGFEHARDVEQERRRHQPLLRRFAAIAVPFGAAASPDLTVLPVALAASALGIGTVVGVLTAFSLVTLSTFVVLTVAATLAGYQVKGEWLEEHGNLIAGVILVAIGVAVYLGV